MRLKNKHTFEMYKKALVITIKFGKDKKTNKNNKKILVISDLHIGFEEFLNEIGILVPRFAFQEMLSELKEIIKKFRINKKTDEIVLLGDVKHAFGKISQQEWRDTLKLIDFLQENCKKLVIVKGNHDVILEPILKIKNIPLKEFYIVDDILFCHGDEACVECGNKRIKYIVAGHLHPVVSIRDKTKVKSEIYKCFLVGKWHGKKLIILPSFLPIIEGANLIKNSFEEYHLGFNVNLNNFDVYVTGDKSGEIYDFGKLKGLKKM